MTWQKLAWHNFQFFDPLFRCRQFGHFSEGSSGDERCWWMLVGHFILHKIVNTYCYHYGRMYALAELRKHLIWMHFIDRTNENSLDVCVSVDYMDCNIHNTQCWIWNTEQVSIAGALSLIIIITNLEQKMSRFSGMKNP